MAQILSELELKYLIFFFFDPVKSIVVDLLGWVVDLMSGTSTLFPAAVHLLSKVERLYAPCFLTVLIFSLTQLSANSWFGLRFGSWRLLRFFLPGVSIIWVGSSSLRLKLFSPFFGTHISTLDRFGYSLVLTGPDWWLFFATP